MSANKSLNAGPGDIPMLAIFKPRKCRVFLNGKDAIATTEDQIGIGIMWLCLKQQDGGYINYPWHQVEKVEFDAPEKP